MAFVAAIQTGGEQSLMNEEDSEDEGLRLLLGGICVSDMASSAWETSEQETGSSDGNGGSNMARSGSGNQLLRHQELREAVGGDTMESPKLFTPQLQNDASFDDVFDHAFHSTKDGKFMRPPVLVTDMSSVNKGNGLVATRNIQRGETIFTEKAVVATQIPLACPICVPKTLPDSMQRELHSNEVVNRGHMLQTFSVRACQNCFRSLEPVSSCSIQLSGNGEATLTLPFPHLWPVPEYESYQRTDEQNPYLKDQHGRILCGECGATFCTVYCKDSHNNLMGSCCICMSSIQAVTHALLCMSPFQATWDNDALDSDDTGANEFRDVQPAAIIAARALCLEVHRFRTKGEGTCGPVDGICGDPNDVTPLELGWMVRKESSNALEAPFYYSLEPAYEAIDSVLELSPVERCRFSLEFFHRLAAVAARNGFDVVTQSPFRSYHSALLRAVGGRGSDGHKNASKEIARVLGSSDGTLNREMDREIAERCAVKIVGLFKLTARINHSCEPCAEVRGQEFVDCHIDLVAKRNIQQGEEVTISYINFGTRGRAHDANKRRRELRARYLFTCDCDRCTKRGKTKLCSKIAH